MARGSCYLSITCDLTRSLGSRGPNHAYTWLRLRTANERVSVRSGVVAPTRREGPEACLAALPPGPPTADARQDCAKTVWRRHRGKGCAVGEFERRGVRGWWHRPVRGPRQEFYFPLPPPEACLRLAALPEPSLQRPRATSTTCLPLCPPLDPGPRKRSPTDRSRNLYL